MANEENKINRIKGYNIDELRALRNNIKPKMAGYLFDIINYEFYKGECLQALEILYYLKLDDLDFEKVKIKSINIATFKEFTNNKKEILELMLIAIIDKARENDNASLFIKAVQLAKEIGLKFN